MPIDPVDLHHATQPPPGTLSVITAGLGSALALIGGFVFRDQTSRLKDLEKARIDLGAKMATKEDIDHIYEKIDRNHDITINRIVEIIRDGS